MHYLLAVVEGETEKALIQAFVQKQAGQSPEKYGHVEVVPIPADGNQGYTKLVEVAELKVNEYLNDPDNCYEVDHDDVEKWLVFDYDDIESKPITLDELKSEAEAHSFSCIISKPKIEFFILAILKGWDFAEAVNPDNYKHEINEAIKHLNREDAKDKLGFSDSIKIPPYDKKIHQCRECLLTICTIHSDLVDEVLGQERGGSGEHYSEMPRLFRRILQVINGEQTLPPCSGNNV